MLLSNTVYLFRMSSMSNTARTLSRSKTNILLTLVLNYHYSGTPRCIHVTNTSRTLQLTINKVSLVERGRIESWKANRVIDQQKKNVNF